MTKIETPIKSVADLAAQTTIKYGTVKNTYAQSMFRSSQVWGNFKEQNKNYDGEAVFILIHPG